MEALFYTLFDDADVNVLKPFDNRTLMEWFLFPYPRTFSDFDEAERLGLFVPRLTDSLVAMFTAAIVITILRRLFHWFVAVPIGRAFKVSDRRLPLPDPSVELEKLYKSARGRPKEKHVNAGTFITGKPARYVERWFRLRRAVNQPNTLDKMSETLWRFLFYTVSTTYGYLILRNKSWFLDTNFCWLGLGFQDITFDVRMYYYVEIGFYLSLLYSLSTDTKRKDFLEMVVHHVVTILLMGFSWAEGFYRIGTLILFVHDVSDIFLEGAKFAHYTGMQTTKDVLFATFAVVFAVSRLYYFPFWAIETVAVKSINLVGLVPVWWVYMILLCSLQVLHIFWFSIIVTMVVKAIRSGGVDQDERSDEELELDEHPTEHVEEKKTL